MILSGLLPTFLFASVQSHLCISIYWKTNILINLSIFHRQKLWYVFKTWYEIGGFLWKWNENRQNPNNCFDMDWEPGLFQNFLNHLNLFCVGLTHLGQSLKHYVKVWKALKRISRSVRLLSVCVLSESFDNSPVDPYYQELIIEERVSNFAMGYQKCGPKVHRLPFSLQEFTRDACINFQRTIQSQCY